MRKSVLFSLFILMLTLFSCEKNEIGDLTAVAIPVTQSVADFRASVEVLPARQIKESGKIYVYQDIIFINDKNEGVHVIDNSKIGHPRKMTFIKIPLNTDVAVKDGKLYANSGMDLVVFDISNLEAIEETVRIQDVFPNYFHETPSDVAYIDYQQMNNQDEIIVDYKIEYKKIERADWRNGGVATDGWFASESGSLASGGSGTGGSMARFNIQDDFLYIVDQSNLSVLDISNPTNPEVLHSEGIGWNIETIFNYEDHLYLGSDRGMYIFSIEDQVIPQFVSYLQHVQGCDPVVVQGDYAYVTIRGGNECGQNFNQLDVVNIKDKSKPFIEETYEMDGPYGLGVKDDRLFVCDGDSGLKVYDTQNTPDLRLIDQFSNINTYDVIPMEEVLLLVGDHILHQYAYDGSKIDLISSFNLD